MKMKNRKIKELEAGIRYGKRIRCKCNVEKELNRMENELKELKIHAEDKRLYSQVERYSIPQGAKRTNDNKTTTQEPTTKPNNDKKKRD